MTAQITVTALPNDFNDHITVLPTDNNKNNHTQEKIENIKISKQKSKD